MSSGEGYDGGIGMMNDEKGRMVEKASTGLSALRLELPLFLEITKVIRTLTEPMYQRSNESFAILHARITAFYERIIFSAL